MSDPWPQDEREDKEAQPVADEPERQSDIVELDDDWEDWARRAGGAPPAQRLLVARL